MVRVSLYGGFFLVSLLELGHRLGILIDDFNPELP